MKILATGDFQLGLGDRLDDQAAVLDRIADVAVERHVGLVLNAGDTFEGAVISEEERAVFASFVARLRGLGIPLLTTLGNGRHDRAVREVNGLAIFDHIAGVTIAHRPDVFQYDDVIVATLPWVHHGRRVAAHGGGDRDEINREIVDLLLAVARRGAADCQELDPDAAHILLAHWHVDQADAPTGGKVGDLFGEPLLPLYELEALGFDAVVLGHNHRGQLLCAEPPIFHVGSPLAHDFGEAGFEHGVWILEGAPGALTTEFVPVESRKLVTFDVDFTDGDDFSQLIEAAWPERVGDPPDNDFAAGVRDLIPDGAIVRVRYRATADQARRLDVGECRRALLELGAAVVKIQPDIVRADRARVEGVDETLAPLQALDLYLETNSVDGELGDRMRARTALYLETVA